MSRVHYAASGSVPTELVARLENASAGSRELDGLIARHFGWHRVEPRHTRNKAGGWIAPEDFLGVWERDGSPRLDSLRGTDIHRDPPRLSQSLDAALALAERVLPGSDWPTLYAAMMHWKAHDPRGPLATTLPLAMCAAILKATPAPSAPPVGMEAEGRNAPESAPEHEGRE